MKEQFFRRSLSDVRWGILLVALAPIAQPCRAQVNRSKTVTSIQNVIPEPAIPAILKAFETFEVVGMPAAHGQKEIDDFILSLIRDPRFPALVNDVVVECGNVRYQPILDRYIAGEDVPFTEVQHVWRDTTVQQMCGSSGFYEQLYPLVRSLNRHLTAGSRLRVVAADPPIDWSKIQSYQDLTPFFDRDGSIASIMEKEVLSKHRKALMLFGVFHLLHGGGPGEGDAVTRYERHYPGRTFIVISDPGYYGTSDAPLLNANAPGGVWPSLTMTKNSKLGSLSLDTFMDSPLTTDQDCNVIDACAKAPAKTIADQMDAILYLGPPGSQLSEPLPADIALDRAYRAEWLRRMKLVGLPSPSTPEEVDAKIVASAADPVLTPPARQSLSQEMTLRIRQSCLSTMHPAAITSK
jgi:hypothetical protein